MQGLPDLAEALAAPLPVLMDGAMGTELTRRGAPIGAAKWVGSTLDMAGDVADLHRAYDRAGAKLHIANTFAAARHVLRQLDQEDRFEAVNSAAVRVCRDAVCGGWIAGSISTYVIGSDRANLPRGAELTRSVEEQARLLADLGCEMIVLEMLFDVETNITMIEAVASAGLPLSVGLTCMAGPGGAIHLRDEYIGRLRPELRLETAMPQIVAALPEGAVLTIMHSDLDVTDRALEIARDTWSGLLGVYPNSGRLIVPDGWDHGAVCTPEVFVDHALNWVRQGAAFIGGCCGIGPDHIAALARALNEENQDG